MREEPLPTLEITLGASAPSQPYVQYHHAGEKGTAAVNVNVNKKLGRFNGWKRPTDSLSSTQSPVFPNRLSNSTTSSAPTRLAVPP